VEIVSIGAGLLLSSSLRDSGGAAATKRNPDRLSFAGRLRRQFKLGASRSHPAPAKKRLVFIGTPLIAAMIGYAANVLPAAGAT